MVQDPQRRSIILQAFQKKIEFPTPNQITGTTSDPPGCIQLPKRSSKTPETRLFTPHMYQSAQIHKKGTQKMQEVSPDSHPHHLSGSIPSCHAPVKPWRQFLTHSHALWRAGIVLSDPNTKTTSWHLSPKELFVKYFKSCLYKSKAYFCGEIPTGIWWKPFATVVPHSCDHQRSYTPEEMVEPTSSAEHFLMNTPAPIFYGHGFHLHLWNCFTYNSTSQNRKFLEQNCNTELLHRTICVRCITGYFNSKGGKKSTIC